MNYVTSVVMQFTAQNENQVVIKARGRYISRAVDVAEVASKRFLDSTIETKETKIGSEDFTNREGRPARVSFIEITIGKK